MKKVATAQRQIHNDNSEQCDSDIACFRCGVCCSIYQPRLVTSEVEEIASRLNLTGQTFIEQYADKRWPGTESILLRHQDGGCVFLDQPQDSVSGLCRIHEFEPECCRQWQAGLNQKECQQGLTRYWGLTVDNDGKPAGSPEKIRKFQAFLESLQ
jgi:uncharacterized protein